MSLSGLLSGSKSELGAGSSALELRIITAALLCVVLGPTLLAARQAPSVPTAPTPSFEIPAAPPPQSQEVTGPARDPWDDVTSGWKFLPMAGDGAGSPVGAASVGWRTTDMTATWEDQGLLGHDGAVWYQRTVVLSDAALAAPGAEGLALVIGPTRHGWVEIYADGAPLGRIGSPLNTIPFPLPRLFPIPEALSADGEVLLGLRFHRNRWASDEAGLVNGPVEGGITVGDQVALSERLELGRLRRLQADVGSLLFAVVFLLAGLYHLQLFYRRPRQTAYFWFGLGSTAFALNAVLFSSWVTELSDLFTLPYRLTDAAGHIATACLIGFVWAILDRPVGKWLRGYQLTHVALAGLLLIAPFQWVMASDFVRFLWIIPILVVGFGVLVIEARKGHPEARTIIIGGTILVAAEALEIARLFDAPVPPSLPNLGFLALMLSMGISLSNRFSRVHEELDALRLDLEARVAARTIELETAVQIAEEANQAKSRFLANTSHELRTPLNSVIGFANILNRRCGAALEPKDRDFLERIGASGKHLLHIINNILDLSEVEAGRMELNVEDTDLAWLVSTTVDEMQGDAQARGLRLTAEVPASLAPSYVDGARLQQVVANLIANALRFTDEGGVHVRLVPEGWIPVRIEVTDTGIGVPADRLETIFGAFEQADTSTTRRHDGPGLGLAISRAYCELMDCQLHVRSQEGVGTTFWIDLPAAAALERTRILESGGTLSGEAPFDTSAEASAVPTGAEAQRQLAALGGSGKTVLVIDDEEDARVLLREYVEELGCQVFTAASGIEGLRLAREVRPHLITLDLKMPGLSGWTTLRSLKADQRLRHIPVVVVSIVASESAGSLYGEVDLVDKPIDPAVLARVVLGHLKDATASRALVVDDDLSSQVLLTEILDPFLDDVRTAGNGVDALRVLQEFDPEVILLDLVMPEMDGMEFLQRLRADPKHERTPVIVVSAKDLGADELEVLRTASQGVLKKGPAGVVGPELRKHLAGLLQEDPR